jgi:hypothetical protein
VAEQECFWGPQKDADFEVNEAEIVGIIGRDAPVLLKNLSRNHSAD